ncbi:MAG TPA: L,D-transpeptidase [Verrucomicrobiales bacterium]|nr:L,D-transpeptidase [Verrucomicrobiales bacterium]
MKTMPSLRDPLPAALRLLLRIAPTACAALFLANCSSVDRSHAMVVSVADQRMVVLHKGSPIAEYPVSTSKFGAGDAPGSCCTPLGQLEVARKIGEGAPPGAVFKHRRPTGEILPPNAPGRDPIVTRILWLRGRDSENANAFRRYIYIHGTPEEYRIGEPASYGCIRMRSRDVIELYDRVGVGARIEVVPRSLHRNERVAQEPPTISHRSRPGRKSFPS